MKEPTFNFELSGYAITQIESPSRENWYDAIKRDPLALRYLDMRHPERRRLEILALELDWMSIKHFRNPANQDIYKSILQSPYAIEQLDMYRKRDLEILACLVSNAIVFYGEIGSIRKNLESLYGHYTDYHKIKRNEKWMDQPVTFARFEM